MAQIPYLIVCSILYFFCWYYTVGFPLSASAAGSAYFVVLMWVFYLTVLDLQTCLLLQVRIRVHRRWSIRGCICSKCYRGEHDQSTHHQRLVSILWSASTICADARLLEVLALLPQSCESTSIIWQLLLIHRPCSSPIFWVVCWFSQHTM